MQKSLIYIDVRTGNQVTATGMPATLPDIVTLERGQWQIICVQLVECTTDVSGATHINYMPVQSGTSLVLVGDNDYNDDNSLMFKSYQSTIEFSETDAESNRFNIAGDWIGGYFTEEGWEYVPSLNPDDNFNAKPELGQISIRVNTDTVKFAEALKGKQQVTTGLYMYLKQYISGIANPTTIGRVRFIAMNTIRDWNQAAEEPPAGVNLVPFVDSFLRNRIEIQYSDNGITWGDSVDKPTFYRFRIANTTAGWSDAVPIIHGQQGDPGPKGDNGVITEEDKAAMITEIETHIDSVTLPDLKAYVQEELANGSW